MVHPSRRRPIMPSHHCVELSILLSLPISDPLRAQWCSKRYRSGGGHPAPKKAGWRHPENGELHCVDSHPAVQNHGIAAKFALPEGMADHHARGTSAVVFKPGSEDTDGSDGFPRPARERNRRSPTCPASAKRAWPEGRKGPHLIHAPGKHARGKPRCLSRICSHAG